MKSISFLIALFALLASPVLAQTPQLCSSSIQSGAVVWNCANLSGAPLAQYQFNAAIAAGLAVTSTSAPSLNGTYALDSTTQFNVTVEMVSIDTNSAFTNGQGSKAWLDATGAFHTFTVAQFKTFATAVAQYVDALETTEQALMAGQTAAWPSSSQAIP